MRIIDRIGTMYAEFGTLLLKDTYGMKLKTIIEVANGHPSIVVKEIFIKWLTGAGKLPVTWKTLIGTLHMVKMSILADDISAVFACYMIAIFCMNKLFLI